MIELILTDSTTTATLKLPAPPLVLSDSNNDVQNTTLNNSLKVFMYPGADKTIISNTWEYMTIDEYDAVRGFWKRQRASGEFPRVSVTGIREEIIDMKAYLEMTDKQIIDNCETVTAVTVTFRGS